MGGFADIHRGLRNIPPVSVRQAGGRHARMRDGNGDPSPGRSPNNPQTSIWHIPCRSERVAGSVAGISRGARNGRSSRVSWQQFHSGTRQHSKWPLRTGCRGITVCPCNYCHESGPAQAHAWGTLNPYAPRGIPPEARLREDPRASARHRDRDQRTQRPFRGATTPRDPPPLRLPPRDRRRPRLLGRTQRPDPRPQGPAHGRPRRGPPDRILRFRRTSRPSSTARATSSSGTGAPGSPRRPPSTAASRSQTASSSSGSTARSSRAVSRSSGRAVAAAVARSKATTASSGSSSTRPTRLEARLGRRGVPAKRQVGRTNDEVKENRDAIWISRRPRRQPRSTSPGPSPRRSPRSSRCSPRSPIRPSTTRTGCSRSSGTVSASRPSSTTASPGS